MLSGLLRELNYLLKHKWDHCIHTPYNNQQVAFYWCIYGVSNDLSTDIKRKKPTQNSLESANLQEHYITILKVRNIACVTVIAMYCISFMKRKKLVNEM